MNVIGFGTPGTGLLQALPRSGFRRLPASVHPKDLRGFRRRDCLKLAPLPATGPAQARPEGPGRDVLGAWLLNLVDKEDGAACVALNPAAGYARAARDALAWLRDNRAPSLTLALCLLPPSAGRLPPRSKMNVISTLVDLHGLCDIVIVAEEERLGEGLDASAGAEEAYAEVDARLVSLLRLIEGAHKGSDLRALLASLGMAGELAVPAFSFMSMTEVGADTVTRDLMASDASLGPVSHVLLLTDGSKAVALGPGRSTSVKAGMEGTGGMAYVALVLRPRYGLLEGMFREAGSRDEGRQDQLSEISGLDESALEREGAEAVEGGTLEGEISGLDV